MRDLLPATCARRIFSHKTLARPPISPRRSDSRRLDPPHILENHRQCGGGRRFLPSTAGNAAHVCCQGPWCRPRLPRTELGPAVCLLSLGVSSTERPPSSQGTVLAPRFHNKAQEKKKNTPEITVLHSYIYKLNHEILVLHIFFLHIG